MTRIDVHHNGPRPDCRLVLAFLWGGASCDTDGDSHNPADREWTQLYARHRDRPAEVFDVLPVSTEPLVLKVESPHDWLAARVAYLLAASTGGRVAAGPAGPWEPADSMLSRVGSFDVDAAWKRFHNSPFQHATLDDPYPNLRASRDD